ncbi:polyprenyl diphosphate synthase [Methanothrix sp.]|uniref:polyprenyl diphosphate synthase n=1 Tax=Methanothrix sp. TaxID=90426 RepID=UPI003C7248B2
MSSTTRNPVYLLYERMLKAQVLAGAPVEHVAIIQDGNRRYARRKGLSQFLGHSLGAETSERVSDWCLELGVRHLTLYAFSTENFSRDESEKGYLFDLIKEKFNDLRRSKKTHNNRVRVRAIGRLEMLPEDLREEIRLTEEATRNYSRMYLNVALAYGGQRELVDAACSLARLVMEGKIRARDLNESLIAQHLYPQDGTPVPKVDLIIRTAGDFRTSNFLPWQANGNECAAYFCAPFWPEFRKIDFLRAIRTAQTRASCQ